MVKWIKDKGMRCVFCEKCGGIEYTDNYDPDVFEARCTLCGKEMKP